MKTKEHDVAELVKSAQEGDEQAMSELITIHKGLVFTVIMRMVNDYDTSQDLTQETFIKLFLNIHKVKETITFRAWLCRVAKNLTYDFLRKRKRQKTVSLHGIGEQIGQDGMKMKRKTMIIQDALAKLASRDRMLLSLAYYQGLKLAEVAQVMKIPLRNIKVYLHRARLRLRDKLKGREDELLSS